MDEMASGVEKKRSVSNASSNTTEKSSDSSSSASSSPGDIEAGAGVAAATGPPTKKKRSVSNASSNTTENSTTGDIEAGAGAAAATGGRRKKRDRSSSCSSSSSEYDDEEEEMNQLDFQVEAIVANALQDLSEAPDGIMSYHESSEFVRVFEIHKAMLARKYDYVKATLTPELSKRYNVLVFPAAKA